MKLQNLCSTIATPDHADCRVIGFFFGLDFCLPYILFITDGYRLVLILATISEPAYLRGMC